MANEPFYNSTIEYGMKRFSRLPGKKQSLYQLPSQERNLKMLETTVQLPVQIDGADGQCPPCLLVGRKRCFISVSEWFPTP
ncbi:hypothetical protein JTE90_004170 [Oedothorax gibbosus]|uniref:Uncharacterized protein n=1 Tax=Oedothorax gibbosus TaxID=931172 RepID=A0AAV6TUR4_9ARAC|nr:hypothetical protein JTE90_004170 [Oedothorax gibbosus]